MFLNVMTFKTTIHVNGEKTFKIYSVHQGPCDSTQMDQLEAVQERATMQDGTAETRKTWTDEL